MLEFKNRELLEKYQYNTVALSNDLMDRMHHIQSLERQVNIPLRRSRLSGKMETTCPDRRKPL